MPSNNTVELSSDTSQTRVNHNYNMNNTNNNSTTRPSISEGLLPNNFDESDPGEDSSDEQMLLQMSHNHFNFINFENTLEEHRETPSMTAAFSGTNQDLQKYEKYLKNRIRYYFMTPCQKWKFKNRKPFKLSIQLMKIVLVTLQVVLFGTLSMETSDYISSNLETFRTLFLNEDLAQAKLTDGSEGLALAQKSNFYTSINHVRKIYSEIDDTNFDVFGTNFENNTMVMCMKSYNNMTINPSQGTYKYDPRDLNETCYTLVEWRGEDIENEIDCASQIPVYVNVKTKKPEYYPFKMENAEIQNKTVSFSELVSLHLHFKVRTIRLKMANEGSTPDCVEHRIKVHYENGLHSGIIGYRLTARQHYRHCKSLNDENKNIFQSNIILLTVLDLFCLCLCLVSLALCIRSILNGLRLGRKFTNYYFHKYGYKPSYKSRFHFFNLWYFSIIFADLVIVIGSMLKMDLENKWVGIIDYSSCQLLLGIGIGITWIGLLRYIGFFKQYNIIVTVLKSAMPHCFKFLITSSILYVGFVLCGWLILGPYNFKFRSVARTSVTLFSLLNGDDMYNTFEINNIPEDPNYLSIKIFNQLYLYSFIFLFIYVVLSLFLAVILDVYETIKNQRGTYKLKMDELEKFIGVSVLDRMEPVRNNF